MAKATDQGTAAATPLDGSDSVDGQIIDEQTAVEHLDVLVIGAGLSGIGAGHYLQTKTPWASYAIFEARDRMGGTWDLFRYPGIRSDSDMYTLGYSFRPWPFENSIADGPSILAYINDTAKEEGIDQSIRFGHRILTASWDSVTAKWTVTGERRSDADSPAVPFTVTCGFIVSCSGYYRYDRGHQPEFAGVGDFKGQFIHPQFWPENLEYADKKVVVIGSGATAVTLVPAMAEKAAHVTMLQRSPTYMVSLPRNMPTTKAIRKLVPKSKQGNVLKWWNALSSQTFFELSQRRPKVVKRMLRKGLERELPPGYDLDTHFTPRYNPWDQRLCLVADGDLFAAVRNGKASIVTDEVDRFAADGIVLKSGDQIDADIVVSATGLEVLFIGGVEVSVDGTPLDVASKLAYKGMMLEDLPNFAMVIGYTNASWTLKAELTLGHVTDMLNHMRKTGKHKIVPVNTDEDIQRSSLLGLTAGYVTRAADRMPQQGDRFPWRVYQSYLKDYRALKKADIEDGALVFSAVGAQDADAGVSLSEGSPNGVTPVAAEVSV